MPLRDHFHAPWADVNPWEGFHSAWVNTMVRHLNETLLPPDFRAIPNVHLGPTIEADVSTWEGATPATPSGPASGNGGIATWSPPAPAQTLEIEPPREEVCEVRVVDDRFNARLAAVIELVSPANKDRPETRQTFVAKCATLLRQGVHLLVVDVLTHRRANLHVELLRALDEAAPAQPQPELYAVSYLLAPGSPRWRLSLWPFGLAVGRPLPTLPLWLTQAFAVPLDLETTYAETSRVLRIR